MTDVCPHCGKPLTAEAENLIDAGFDEFWQLYPRHVARKVAKTKWQKLGKRKKKAALEHLRRKPFAAVDAQYIPHPSTYINQERWEDEPASPATPDIEPILGI